MAEPARPITLLSQAALPTRFGEFNVAVFEIDGTPGEAVALMRGPLGPDVIPLVRLHSECLTGDVLGSMRCDCGQQLSAALALIAKASSGVLLYLRQEGRGIGLANKIRAYALQDTGLDTVDANLALGLPVDRREYASAAAILRELGICQVRLLTNNLLKSAALERHGVQVIERVPLTIRPNSVNGPYLRTKAVRMGHLLPFER
jgi:GTP cyclohydrolase II